MLLAPSESAALSVKMASMSNKLGETTRISPPEFLGNSGVAFNTTRTSYGPPPREARGPQSGIPGLRSERRFVRNPLTQRAVAAVSRDSAAPQNFSALGATARGRGARWNIGDYPETYEGTTPRQGTSRRPRPDLARSPSFGGFERLAALRVTTDVIPRFLDAPSPPAPMMAHPAAGAARLELYNFYTITRVNASQVKSIGFPK